MFYKIKDNTIYDYAEHKYAPECLETNIVTSMQLDESRNIVIVQDGVLILNPDYEEEQAQKREEAFYKEFIEIENFGCLRKKPKGYSSIIEAFNTMFNLVNVMGSLPKDLITIYPKPDFTNKEQCAEDWLVQNSFMNTTLSAAEFSTLYSGLLEKYNMQEHLI